jgi:hypothetical protein
MNGATAELWVNSISPPKSAMTRKTGSSQNFFRTRRKAQNSRRKPSIRSSELVPECFGCGAGRLAHDPVALRRWLEFPPHRILASEPHQQANGGDAAVEQDAENERAHDRVQQPAEFCPQAVQGREQAGRGIREQREQRSQGKPQLPAGSRAPEAQRTEEQEAARENETEAPL